MGETVIWGLVVFMYVLGGIATNIAVGYILEVRNDPPMNTFTKLALFMMWPLFWIVAVFMGVGLYIDDKRKRKARERMRM